MAEGSGMATEDTRLNQLSLANIDVLKISNAAVEFVISGLLVCFLFWARQQQRQETHEARETQLTPADFSVMISGLPEDTVEPNELRDFLAELDETIAKERGADASSERARAAAQVAAQAAGAGVPDSPRFVRVRRAIAAIPAAVNGEQVHYNRIS
eukprot:7133160-Prymnesium_polylepis.1